MIRYNLKPMLKKYGITQTELMKKLHISSTTMAKFKKNEPVSLTVIDAICTELGCSISDLITIERQNSILLQRFLDEKKIKLSNGLYHEVQILFAYNSNRIEGSKLSKDETRYIYETNTIDGTKNVNDIIEMVNHFKCFDYMLDSIMEPLSERLIKEYHRILKSNTADSNLDWFAVGDYKKAANTVGGLETCKPEQVSENIRNLLYWYDNLEEITLEHITDFHFRFERIHPFQDGNGRDGRLILFRECLRNNIIPFIVDESHKMYYYRGLSEYNSEKGYLIGTFESAQDEFSRLIKMYE